MQSIALICPAILTSATTRADGSLSLRFSTPELKSAEKAAFFELQNQNLKMLLQPTDLEPVGITEIKGEFDSKSPSQRLRGCLYRLWQYETAQKRCEISFNAFYLDAYEVLIQGVKDKLPEPQF